MARTKKRLIIAFITILLCMVFAVNIGWTFALPDYQKRVKGLAKAGDSEVYTYLNDVVVNNSTTASPIAFTNGTVEREINFDYSFSENTDIAVKYNLKYTSGEDANNVKLNIVNRDDYILDTTQVSPQGKTYYEGLSSSGTLFYLPTIQAGHGSHKLISSVTFYSDSNEISSYYASQAVTLKQISYTLNTVYTDVEFEYTHQDIARYWGINSYTDGENVITVNEYNALTPAEQQSYEINEYIALDGYSLTSGSSGYTSVSANKVITVSNYANYINAGDTNWELSYYCITAFGSYTKGQSINATTYNSLSQSQKNNFIPQHTCKTAYTVKGATTKTYTANQEISASEFNSLFVLEQRNFLPKAHTSYDNKRLIIEIEVYTKLSSDGANAIASDYYTSEHYFKNLQHTSDTTAFTNWLNYKSNQAVSANSLLLHMCINN